MERSVNRTDIPALDAQPTEGPHPTLGARHVAAIVVGIVIGAGIFRTPSLVAGAAGSEAAFLSAWIAGGLMVSQDGYTLDLDYKRIAAPLKSGVTAWVYVKA